MQSVSVHGESRKSKNAELEGQSQAGRCRVGKPTSLNKGKNKETQQAQVM